MKEREDIRYDLSDFHKKDDKIISDFKYISRQIKLRKSFFIRYEGANFEVYHPLLALFFSQTQITLNEQLNKQNTKAIITYDYFESFMQGYNEGTEYFKKNYNATPELIYGKNAELYVKDIHSMFFHKGCSNPTEGWFSYVKSFTTTLSHSIIKNYGFYSGIVREVQITIGKHPELFREFDNCKNEPSNLKAPESIKAIFKTTSYQLLEKESCEFLEPWQTFDISNLSSEERYQIDKESYLKEFFNTPHKHQAEFDEVELVRQLSNNIQTAKHPVLVNYRKYLEGKLLELFKPIAESPYSVLEWATIFYYADETKLLTNIRLRKTRMEQFMSKHHVNTTPVNFKNSYHEAKRRINKKQDYPINKLELILPFLKENYEQTVTKVENDIIILKENKLEN